MPPLPLSIVTLLLAAFDLAVADLCVAVLRDAGVW
jgi:hypothetical protein